MSEGLDPPGGLTTTSYPLGAVRSRRAYMIDWLARDVLVDRRLVELLPEWTPPYPGNCLYFPRQRHMTVAFRTFVDHLQEMRAR